MPKKVYTLFSGGAQGAEACFGENAEKFGITEVNYSYEGHETVRSRGLKILTPGELALKDVSLAYVSRLMNRAYKDEPAVRKILQTICWQVSSAEEVFVIGVILEDNTVKGGTGFGAEFAKLCNKPLWIYDQTKEHWFKWGSYGWEKALTPVITYQRFCGTGSLELGNPAETAINDLFHRSFA